jgi:hypothetical protein
MAPFQHLRDSFHKSFPVGGTCILYARPGAGAFTSTGHARSPFRFTADDAGTWHSFLLTICHG